MTDLSINPILSVARSSGSKNLPFFRAQIYRTASRNLPSRTSFEKHSDVATGFGSQDYSLKILPSLCINPEPARRRCPCSTSRDVKIFVQVSFSSQTPGRRAVKQLSEKQLPSPRSTGDS